MRTRQFGEAGQVSVVGLGGMPLSIEGRPGEASALRVIRAAIDSGMTLLDTADVYCMDQSDYGHNEELFARVLAELGADADDLLVATKGGLVRPGGAWVPNGHPEHLKDACEASLEALGVDCIDLYQLHAPDRNIPWEDSVGALADLRFEGKIRWVGLSNVESSQIEAASQIVPILSVQNRCNLFDRESFLTGVVATCEEMGLAFLAHSPVGGHQGHWRVKDDPTLLAIASRHEASTYQVALAWLLARSPALFVIPGASKVKSVVSSAAAAELQLTEQDLAELDALEH